MPHVFEYLCDRTDDGYWRGAPLLEVIKILQVHPHDISNRQGPLCFYLNDEYQAIILHQDKVRFPFDFLEDGGATKLFHWYLV